MHELGVLPLPQYIQRRGLVADGSEAYDDQVGESDDGLRPRRKRIARRLGDPEQGRAARQPDQDREEGEVPLVVPQYGEQVARHPDERLHRPRRHDHAHVQLLPRRAYPEPLEQGQAHGHDERERAAADEAIVDREPREEGGREEARELDEVQLRGAVGMTPRRHVGGAGSAALGIVVARGRRFLPGIVRNSTRIVGWVIVILYERGRVDGRGRIHSR